MAQLVVGISDLKIAKPPDTLITYALGSCVGICLIDPFVKVAGLSHIMLPDSTAIQGERNPFKFADTAIPDLIRRMEAQGAKRIRMKAKIAGGAQMFEMTSSAANSSTWQIGQRNVAAVTETLKKLNIQIVAQDVLKNYGRTVLFDPETGTMVVKAVTKGTNKL